MTIIHFPAVHAMWQREVKRYLRSRVQIIASLAQPMMYLLILGFGLSPVFKQAGEGDYFQFIAPGIVGMSVLFSAVFSGVGMLWDRQFGFLKETLVAPVPRSSIMLGRTLGGATTASIQGSLVFVICIIAGFRPNNWALLPVALLIMLLIATVFAALGTAIGSTLKDMQGFQIIMNFLVMPLFFLSGALYRLKDLPVALTVLTSLDPLSYGIDAMRTVLIADSYFGIALDLGVLLGAATLFLALGSYFFSKIEA
jgi:ABC-2 type transport system permease protein